MLGKGVLVEVSDNEKRLVSSLGEKLTAESEQSMACIKAIEGPTGSAC